MGGKLAGTGRWTALVAAGLTAVSAVGGQESLGPSTPQTTVQPAEAAETRVVPSMPADEPVLAPVLPGQEVLGDPASWPVFNLVDAVTEALANNPALGVDRQAINRALAEQRAAEGARFPPVSFSYAEVWQDQVKAQFDPAAPAVVIQPGNTRTFTLQSNWVIYAGGALEANQAIAKLSEAAARQGLRATVSEVVNATVTGYLRLLAAQETAEVTDRTVSLAREQLQVARLSFEAGAVPRVNVLRSEAALQNALQAQLQAYNGIELARSALLVAMGRSQLQPVRVAPIPRQLAEVPELLGSLRRAVWQRPELRAQQHVIEINEEQVRAARAGYYPQVQLNSQISRSSNSGAFGANESFRFALGVNWNLWDWGVTKGRVLAADAEVRAQRFQLEELLHNIELQVRNTVLTIESARRRVAAAQAEVEAAREALEIETLRYTAGESVYLEFLDARRALSEAETNLVSAYYDNALAEAEWLAATGAFAARDQSVPLPHGEAAPVPAQYEAGGLEYEQILERYGLDPASGEVRPEAPAAPGQPVPAAMEPATTPAEGADDEG